MEPVRGFKVVDLKETVNEHVNNIYWLCVRKTLERRDGIVPLPNSEFTTPELLEKEKKFNIAITDERDAFELRKKMKDFKGRSDGSVNRRFRTFKNSEISTPECIILAKSNFILDSEGQFMIHLPTGLSKSIGEFEDYSKVAQPKVIEIVDNQLRVENCRGWLFRDFDLPDFERQVLEIKLMEGIASVARFCAFQPIGMRFQYYVNSENARQEEVFSKCGIRVLGPGIDPERWNHCKQDTLMGFIRCQKKVEEIEEDLRYNSETDCLFIQDPEEVCAASILRFLRSRKPYDKLRDSERKIVDKYVPKNTTPDSWKDMLLSGSYKLEGKPEFRRFLKKFKNELVTGTAKTGERMMRFHVQRELETLRDKGVFYQPDKDGGGLTISMSCGDEEKDLRASTTRFREMMKDD